jgi:hypothetical protein
VSLEGGRSLTVPGRFNVRAFAFSEEGSGNSRIPAKTIPPLARKPPSSYTITPNSNDHPYGPAEAHALPREGGKT